MNHGWVINAVGLFVTTVGALLLFLHVQRMPSLEELQTEEGQQAFARQRRGLATAVGLLALWVVLQDLALILL